MIRKWLIGAVFCILAANLGLAALEGRVFALRNGYLHQAVSAVPDRQIVFTITDGNVLTVTDGVAEEFMRAEFSEALQVGFNNR